jgi:hypothetical protein
LRDQTARGELVDERAIHLLVEVEIEGVERAIGITKARLFVSAGAWKPTADAAPNPT